MSLYYENNEPTEVKEAYMNNKKVWSVYKGNSIVWSFKYNYTRIKMFEHTSIHGDLSNITHLRFFDMRNKGLNDTIKGYEDWTNHLTHCRNVYIHRYVYDENSGLHNGDVYSCTNNFEFDDGIEEYSPFLAQWAFGEYLELDTNAIPYTYFIKNVDSPDGVDRVDTTMPYEFFNGIFRNCMSMAYSFDSQRNMKGKAVCGLKTKNMASCYGNCQNLTTAVCGPNVINMAYCYNHCYSLENAAASGPNVVNMKSAYEYCNNLKYAACGDNVIDMSGCYEHCKNLLTSACGERVENMYYAYYYCNSIEHAECGNNVIDMHSAYNKCTNLISGVVGASVQNGNHAFNDCRNLIDINWHCTAPINMNWMFRNCRNLRTFGVSEQAVAMSSAYYNCFNLIGSVRIPQNVTEANHTFYNCRNIDSAVVESSKLNVLNRTFHYCSNLTSISFDCFTTGITGLYSTFSGCSNLASFYGGYGNFCDVIDMPFAFSDCQSLHMTPIIPTHVVNMADAYYNCQNMYGHVYMPGTIKNIRYAFYNTCVTDITFSEIDGYDHNTQYYEFSSFISAAKEIVEKRGTVTIHCPSGSHVLNMVMNAYDFYEHDYANNTSTYTGHNEAYNIDLA